MTRFDNMNQDASYFDVDNRCSFYDCNGFKDIVFGGNSFNIIHMNIRSVNRNLDEFLLCLTNFKTKFSVIVLTETWLSSSSDWLDIPGYLAFHSIRESKAGGGVSILVKDSLSAELLPSLTYNNQFFESVGVDVTVGGRMHSIIGTYRPPSASLNEFNINYFNMFNNVRSNRKIVVLGDFNVDVLDNNPPASVSTFTDNFRALHFMPLIDMPTRKTAHTESCIDHIYVNTFVPCQSVVLEMLVSDHRAVLCSIPYLDNIGSATRVVKYRDHSEMYMAAFKSDVVEAIAGFGIYDGFSACDRFEVLNNLLFRLYDRNFPVKRKNLSLKRLSCPWMTDELHGFVREKHRLYRLSLSQPEFVEAYRSYRNSLCTRISRAKSQYYLAKFGNGSGDTKSTWKLINRILKPNCNSHELKLQNGDDIVINSEEVANTFNDYFSGVAADLASKIPTVSADPLSYVERVENTFVFFESTAEEIDKIIRSFPSKGC